MDVGAPGSVADAAVFNMPNCLLENGSIIAHGHVGMLTFARMLLEIGPLAGVHV